MKIGIFDSGIGGLTVFKEISKKLPTFEIIYLGDTARLPYGIKSKKTVDSYSINNVSFLQAQGCDIIVIACNTASSYSTSLIKKKFNLPIFDVISSGVDSAIKSSTTRLGVIGTSSTIQSKSYVNILKKRINKIKIFTKACPIFVPIIEQGLFRKKYYKEIIEENLQGLKKKRIDSLILGCTHYPLIKKEIKNFFGDKVFLIDSASEISTSLYNYLKINYPDEFKNVKKKRSVFLTDKSSYFNSVIKKVFKNLDFNIKLIDIKWSLKSTSLYILLFKKVFWILRLGQGGLRKDLHKYHSHIFGK